MKLLFGRFVKWKSGETRMPIGFEWYRPQFDASFFETFLKFMSNEGGFKDTYVHKVAITLKTVLIEAERENVCPSFKYDNRWLKATKREVENIYLTIPELEAIEALDLKNKPGLDKARDLFLVGCNTGLRYSDFSDLKKEFFKEIEGVECLVINTQKTGQLVVIPINDVVPSIIRHRLTKFFFKIGYKQIIN